MEEVEVTKWQDLIWPEEDDRLRVFYARTDLEARREAKKRRTDMYWFALCLAINVVGWLFILVAALMKG